jgi:enoyl-CoA hydratase/3-hydroxyacyl-CoA dehydrogenase
MVSIHFYTLTVLYLTILQGGMGRIKSNLASRVKKGKMTQAAADAALGRVRGVLDYTSFRDVDMVIEAVIEVGGLSGL